MKKAVTILVIAAMLLVMSFSACVFGAESGPGSASDPVVTKSYVDALFSQLSSGKKDSGSTSSFEVIEVAAGSTIVGDEGCEMVMRSGKNTASIPATAGGGIVDLTSGTDYSNGKSIPLNHHLLFSRSDGRGVYCANKAYVMVKGSYSIQ